MWIAQHPEQPMNELRKEGVSAGAVGVRRLIANFRLQGQDASLAIELMDMKDHLSAAVIENRFAKRYREVYGHEPPHASGKPIEIESLRVDLAHTRGEPLERLPIRVDPGAAMTGHQGFSDARELCGRDALPKYDNVLPGDAHTAMPEKPVWTSRCR